MQNIISNVIRIKFIARIISASFLQFKNICLI